MNVFNYVFENIRPIKTANDTMTITGLKISKGELVYRVLTLLYEDNEVKLGLGYISRKEFYDARNLWHCYDINTETNTVTLRRNQEVPRPYEKWDASMDREDDKVPINVSTDDFIELLKIVSGVSSTAKNTDNQKSMYDIKKDEINQKKIHSLISKYGTK